MKERPILFSAPMVRALLAGTKTQTRRVAKPVRHPDLGNLYAPGALVLEHEPQHVIDRCNPYGQPGGGWGLADTSHYHATDPRQSYFSLWEAIDGPGSVEANPWVWAVTFRTATPNK